MLDQDFTVLGNGLTALGRNLTLGEFDHSQVGNRAVMGAYRASLHGVSR